MANQVFNIAKGRVTEYYNRVENNDPATSKFTVVAINAGAATDDTIRGYDDLAALLADVNVAEVTNTNYTRKDLTDTELAALPAPDDVNDRYDLDLPDITWTAIAAGDAWTDLVVCYNPTAGADSTLIPMTLHDFAVTPDGSDIVATTTNFFRAS